MHGGGGQARSEWSQGVDEVSRKFCQDASFVETFRLPAEEMH